MKYCLLVIFSLTLFSSKAQNKDSSAVISTTEKYIQAFYQTKPDWLEEVLHPELIKRTTKSFGSSKKFITTSGKSEMVELAKIFNSKGKFSDKSRTKIELLDLFKDMATVKLTAEKWIDYLHLIKINGQWKIVNVVWLMT